jgi:4a-hydroxytetrahydrobiopterin dehydratase
MPRTVNPALVVVRLTLKNRRSFATLTSAVKKLPPMKPRVQTAFRTERLELAVGPPPRVAGVLSSLARKFPAPGPKPACDVVEVRLDITGRPPGWLNRCRAIQDAGWPVLLTVRPAAEGGRWRGPDEERLRIFEQALQNLAAVDVEWRSPIARSVARTARRLGKICVVSHHDFGKTPPAAELEDIIARAQSFASIVKISTRLSAQHDEKVLRSLLAKKWKVPLCVIGMGSAWAHTRALFPRLGSCLAYGYLDKPTAPGQLSAAELTRQIGLSTIKKCAPCKAAAAPLKGGDLARLARGLAPGWRVEKEHHLERDFKFPDFREALAFTNKVGALAESQNHHPDICLAWGKVKLTLWTHSVDGLTESDFGFAAKVDQLKS